MLAADHDPELDTGWHVAMSAQLVQPSYLGSYALVPVPVVVSLRRQGDAAGQQQRSGAGQQFADLKFIAHRAPLPGSAARGRQSATNETRIYLIP
jgi:hypothetical protein